MIFGNGGVLCDMLCGPCSCGAWHGIRIDIANSKEEIYRFYINYFKKEEDND